MRFKSLKTHIALYYALLLIIAVALTDFVVVQLVERRMIEGAIESTRQLISGLEFKDETAEQSLQWSDSRTRGQTPSLKGLLLTTAEHSSLLLTGEIPSSLRTDAEQLARQAKSIGESQVRFLGKTWGVFWSESQYAVVSQPLGDPAGVATAVLNLEPIYESLREVQKMAAGYLAVNLLVLFIVGIWRMSRMVTRPLQRFVRITDGYQASDRYELFPEKQDDEFSRLSSALNQMLRRIEEDRHKLKSSLVSLEKTNRDLQAAQEEIIRAEKLASIGRLSAGLAHEIGNPIGIVLGYLGLLKSRILPDDDNGMEYLQRAESEINRINLIIRQLLDFSRSAPVEFSVVSVHDLIRNAGDMLAHQPLMDRIRFEYHLEAERDEVFADYHQLHQVVVNMVINAADSIATSGKGDEGSIQVRTRMISDDDRSGIQNGDLTLELKIVDNGSGIDTGDIDKIFDPFFTTKETGKGTGLGLSVSYMIIEQIGGDIKVLSQKGQGTEMTIRLPICPKSEGISSAREDRLPTH